MGIPGEVPPAPQITETSTIVPKDDKANVFKEQDEREEGEIVDDFEDIISSDEEVSMKKRIEELEERNLELEKIARISVVYNYDYNKERYEITNLPVSDISDNDDLYLSPTPFKVKHRSKKSLAEAKLHSGEKLHHRRIRKRELTPDTSLLSSLHSRTKTKKKKNQKLSKGKSRKKTEKIKKKIYPNEASSDEEFCALNRDKLRLALKRDVPLSNKPPNEVHVVDTNQELDDEVQVIEQVVEVVEVESDKDEGVKDNSDKEANKNDSDDSVTLEEQELRLIALKSAIMKKAFKRKKRKESEGKKPYSPSEFLELKGAFISSPRDSMESGPMDISPIASPDVSDIEICNKPIDMELVCSNSSSPVLVGHGGTWIPINNIPLPANDKQSSVIIHTPKAIKSSALSSVDGIVPPKVAPRDNEYPDTTKLYIRSSSPDPSDEEEHALRALLLAKMKSPKARKKTKTDDPTTEKKKESEENRPRSVENNDTETGLDPKALKIVLELSMKESFNNKTELVLKEAVRRLKNQTTCESPDMQIGEDLYRMSVHTNPSKSNPRTPVPVANEQMGAMHPISLREEVKENMQQEILMNAVPVEQRMSATNNVPEYTQNLLENLRDVDRAGAVLQPTAPKRLERNDNFHIHSNQNSVTVNRDVLKVVPVTTLGELQTPKSALVPIPIKPTTTTVKAIHIPKMKTKVIRTRTKVVNKTNTPIAQIKRKLSLKQSEISPVKKKLKPDISLPERKDTMKISSSRLITKLNIPKVQNLIIHLGQSESDSDDLTAELAIPTPINGKDYYDNASPMSLPMDSPCYSPLPKSPACAGGADANEMPDNAKNDEVELPAASNSTKSIVNDVFQARLDEFLKNARSKVEQVKMVLTPNTPNIPKITEVQTIPTVESAKSVVTQATTTPLAVRHLPPSSQLEYRRLVNRMKLLEKQKQARSNKVINKNVEQIKIVIKNKQATEEQKQSPEVPLVVVTAAPTMSLGPTKATSQVVIQKTVLNDVAAMRNESSPKNSLIKKVLTKSVVAKATMHKPPVITGVLIDEGKKAIVLTGKENSAVVTPTKDINMNSEAPKIVSESVIKPAVNPLQPYETEFKENSSRLCEKISKTMELVKVASDERCIQLRLQSKLEQVRKEMLQLETELDAQKKILSKILPEISEHHKNITALTAKCLKIEKTAKAVIKNDNLAGNFKFEGNSVDVKDKYKQFALAIKNLKNMRISELCEKHGTCSDDSCQNNNSESNCESIEVSDKNLGEIATRDKVIADGMELEESPGNNKEEQSVSPQSESVEPFKAQVEETSAINRNITTEPENENRKVWCVKWCSEKMSEDTGIMEDMPSIHTTEEQTQFSCDTAIETNLEIHEGECAIEPTGEVEQDNVTELMSDQIDLSSKYEDVPVPESTENQSSNETVNSDLCSLIASNASLILKKLSQGFFSIDQMVESECAHQDHDTISNEGAMTEEVIEPEADDSTTSVRMEEIVSNELRSEDKSAAVPPPKLKKYASPLEHMNEESHFNPNGIICPFQLMGQCSDEHCKYEHLDVDNR